MSKIALIILHYGSLEVTRECLLSLKQKLGEHQLILVNNTTQNVSTLLKIIPGTQLIDNQANLGFAKAVNQGLTLALANNSITHFLLLNNDLVLTYGTLDELLRTFAKSPRAGIVSPVLHHGVPTSSGKYDWGGKFNRFTGLVKHTNWDNKPKTVLSVDHVAGAAMLFSRELVDKIGILDERFFLYYEDLDYCLRAKAANYLIHINPQVVAEHAVSKGTNVFRRTLYQWHSHILFVAKHLPSTVFPTAFLTDLIFYPLITLKSLFVR